VIRAIDTHLNLGTILLFFWAFFWLLNGGEKFFNGELISNINPWAAKSVLVDSNGEIAYTLHPMEVAGLYGVNRDQQMIHFFQKLDLPPVVALTVLYGIAIAEILLGLLFLGLFGYSFWSKARRQSMGLLADRTLHRLAFKASLLIFIFFTIGDTLFGDRMELWEHSTFIVLALVSYFVWSQADQKFTKQD
jgi:hypothetical protein